MRGFGKSCNFFCVIYFQVLLPRRGRAKAVAGDFRESPEIRFLGSLLGITESSDLSSTNDDRAATVRSCEIIRSEPRSGDQQIAPGERSEARGYWASKEPSPGRGGRSHCSERLSVALPGLQFLIACQPGAALRLPTRFTGSSTGYSLWPLPGPDLDYFTAPERAGSPRMERL